MELFEIIALLVRIKSEFTYANGILHGICKTYNDDGIVVFQDTYVKGERKKRETFEPEDSVLPETKVLGKFVIPEIHQFHVVLIIFFTIIGVLLSAIGLKYYYLKERDQSHKKLALKSYKNFSSANTGTIFTTLKTESEKMYRHMIETVESGIFMANPTGTLLYANHRFAKNFGFNTKTEMVGLNIVATLFSDTKEKEDIITKLTKEKQVQDYQFQYKKPDGVQVTLSANVNYLWDDKGQVMGIEGVVFDITDKKYLEDALLTEKHKMELIIDFFEQIDSFRDLDQLMNFVVNDITDILEATKCSIMLVDKESQNLIIKKAKGLEASVIQKTSIIMGDPIAGIVAKDRKPLLVKNIEYHKRFQRAKRPGYLGRSFMIAPMEVNGKLLGLINVADKPSEIYHPDPFNDIDLRVLSTLAGKVASAIENIELYKELNLATVTDPMTQIYNYRLLSESLDREITRLKRGEGSMCIILLDIDHFKTYNDTFGHLEGDALLKKFSHILKVQLRESDIVCRYAGDEFCVVFPDTDIQGTLNAAEKVRHAVEHGQFKRKVTISMGLAQYQQGMTKKELIEKADKALYQAKNAGRNRAVIYQEKK